MEMRPASCLPGNHHCWNFQNLSGFVLLLVAMTDLLKEGRVHFVPQFEGTVHHGWEEHEVGGHCTKFSARRGAAQQSEGEVH